MKNNTLKKMVSVSLIAAMALSLAACGSTGSASTSTSTSSSTAAESEAEGSEEAGQAVIDGNDEDVNIAVMVNGHSMPFYMAMQEGYFDEENLGSVSMIYFTDGATENEALGSDEWEIGSMGNMPAISGGVAYNSHVIWAAVDESTAVDCFVREDSDIAQITGEVDGHPGIMGNAETWAGKTILVPTGTAAHYALAQTLGMIGLTLDDVEVISMDVSQCYTAFSAGQGDAMVVWPPNSYYAEEDGFVRAWYGGDLGLTIQGYIVASEKVLTEHPEKVAAAMKAALKAIDENKDDTDKVGEYMYQMAQEYGSNMSEDLCKRFASERPLYDLEDNIEFFSGEYGEREIDDILYSVVDFMVQQGFYTEEQEQQLKDSNFLDSTIVDMLAADAGLQ